MSTCIRGGQIMVALCGRDFVPGVRHKIKHGHLFWLHVSGRKADT